MGKAQRDKGRRWEQQVATRFREEYPELAKSIKRGWQSRQGSDDADVCGAPYGIWVECKSGKQVGLREAMRQAETAAEKHALEGRAIPVVFAKDDRKKPVIMMSMDDFFALMHIIESAEREE